MSVTESVHEGPRSSQVAPFALWSVRLAYWVASALTVVLGLGAVLAMVGVVTHRWQADAVLTGSMDPAIPPRSLVIATSQPTGDLKVGQVIMFSAPTDNHERIVHRIIKVDRDKASGLVAIQTKGDANPTADPWTAQIPAEMSLVVRFHVPLAGIAVTDPLVAGSMFVALLLLVFGTSVVLGEWARDPDIGEVVAPE